MNLQESIRRVLREETNLIKMILRRVPHEDLEREFKESLDMASDVFLRFIERNGDTIGLGTFINFTIASMIDGIHSELYSTIPGGDIQWYDDVKETLKEYYKDRIKVRYKRLMSEL